MDINTSESTGDASYKAVISGSIRRHRQLIDNLTGFLAARSVKVLVPAPATGPDVTAIDDELRQARVFDLIGESDWWVLANFHGHISLLSAQELGVARDRRKRLITVEPIPTAGLAYGTSLLADVFPDWKPTKTRLSAAGAALGASSAGF